MEYVEVDDILSTLIVYEGFFYNNDAFKMSKDSINKIEEISNKYANKHNVFHRDNEEFTYLERENNTYSRAFIYEFKDYILIKKIVYPVGENEVFSFEVLELLENGEERLLSTDINKYSNNLDISLNNKAKSIKLIIRCRNNEFPKIKEIKILKDICDSI